MVTTRSQRKIKEESLQQLANTNSGTVRCRLPVRRQRGNLKRARCNGNILETRNDSPVDVKTNLKYETEAASEHNKIDSMSGCRISSRAEMEARLERLIAARAKAESYLDSLESYKQMAKRDFQLKASLFLSKIEPYKEHFLFPELVTENSLQHPGDFETIVEDINASRIANTSQIFDTSSNVHNGSRLFSDRMPGCISKTSSKHRSIFKSSNKVIGNSFSSSAQNNKRGHVLSVRSRNMKCKVGQLFPNNTSLLNDSSLAMSTNNIRPPMTASTPYRPGSGNGFQSKCANKSLVRSSRRSLRSKNLNALNRSGMTSCCIFQRSLRNFTSQSSTPLNNSSTVNKQSSTKKQTSIKRQARFLETIQESQVSDSHIVQESQVNGSGTHRLKPDKLTTKPMRYARSGEAIRLLSTTGSPLKLRPAEAFIYHESSSGNEQRRQKQSSNETVAASSSISSSLTSLYTVITSQSDIKQLHSKMGRRTAVFLKRLQK